jgi:hypothetical protein
VLCRRPPFHATQVVDGYRFQIRGHPRISALQPSFLSLRVTVPFTLTAT